MGPNDRIGIGIVGLSTPCGPGLLLHGFSIQSNAPKNNAVVVAVSDVSRLSLEAAAKSLKLRDSDLFLDYRKMLERKDVDAVILATHDPLRAQICLDAADAGKHVYCELPLTRYLDEAFSVYDKIKSNGIVFQAGARICSAEVWQKAAEVIQSGAIGPLVRGQVSYCRNNPRGEWNFEVRPTTNPATLDWEAWLGPVKTRIPFNAEHFWRWQKYYAYSSGPLGTLGAVLLPGLLFVSNEPDFPVRVNCLSTRSIHTDLGRAATREVPEHVLLQAEFPNGFTIHLICSTVSEFAEAFAVSGQKGTVTFSGPTVEVIPESKFAGELPPNTYKNLHSEDIEAHHKNWFDCIRSGKEPNASIDLALRTQTILSLGEMSDRLKMTCLFDPMRRRITTGDGREVPPITYGSLGQS